MKHKSLLQTTQQVQAILDGRRTRHSMPIKPQPDVSEYASITKAHDRNVFVVDESDLQLKCPYAPGDVVYVKEAWHPINAQEIELDDFKIEVEFRTGESIWFSVNEEVYYATGDWLTDSPDSWKPAINMPKYAARIWLQVEDVRAERLHDISEEDAIAEGIREFTKDGTRMKYWYDDKGVWADMPRLPVAAYLGLLESIHGPEFVKSNPWLWVVKYRVLITTGKPSNL